MSRPGIPSEKPIRSLLIDELDRIRDERISVQKPEKCETDEAAITPTDSLLSATRF
jgi:hypothetical protein